MKVLHLGMENSVIVSHLAIMLSMQNDACPIVQGVVVCGVDGREELRDHSNITRHPRPGSGSIEKKATSSAIKPAKRNQTLKTRVITRLKRTKLLRVKKYLNGLRDTFSIRCRKNDWLDILRQYDVVNLQGMFWGKECEVALKLWNGKLVVSVWGSDLLRQQNESIIRKQRRLLNKADVITVSGVEFQEILLAKFGRHLKPKIKETFFSIGGEVTKHILNCPRQVAREKWYNMLDVKSERKIVCIGHNGSTANNHLPIIEAFSQLSGIQRKECHLVLPMTYGLQDSSYISVIKKSLTEASLDYSILENFLADEEVAELRLTCDIFIYAPESDAFSATVSQSLLAQNVVMCAAWLPYGARRRYGFDYVEFGDFEMLPAALEKVIANHEAYQRKAEKNKDLSISFFDERRLMQGWLSAYQKAVEAC